MLDGVGKTARDIHVVESEPLPSRNTAILAHFRDILLDCSGRELHTLHNRSVVYQKCRSRNCQRLLNHNAEVIRDLRHIVAAKSIHSRRIGRYALRLGAVKRLDNAQHKALRVAAVAPAGLCFLGYSVNAVHLLTNAVLNVSVAVCVLGLLLVVEPLYSVKHGKRHSVILCHTCHMVCEYVEDRVNNDTVIRLLVTRLRKAHIEKRIEARRARRLVRSRLQVSAVRIDREVFGISELFLAEACNRYVVTPSAALLCHKLLHSVCDFLLSVGQLVYNSSDIRLCQRVTVIRYLLAVRRVRRNAHTLAKQMTE